MFCKPQSTSTEPGTGTSASESVPTVAAEPVPTIPQGGRRGGVPKTPAPSLTAVDAELLAASQNVSDSPET
jgi:hypothetical protein